MKHLYVYKYHFSKILFGIFIGLSLSSKVVQAQDKSDLLPCGTSISPEEIQKDEARYREVMKRFRMGAARVAAGTTYLPIRFTFIENATLTRTVDIQSRYDKATKAIVELNQSFLPIGIQFYLTSDNGLSQLPNPNLVKLTSTADNIAYIQKDSPQDAINVYIPASVYDNNGKQIGGFSTFPTASKATNYIVLGYDQMANTKRSLSHEMGHYLNLYHTFENSNASDTKNRELVNGANCSTTGDLICDTPADPYDRLMGTVSTFEGDCKYYGTVRDANGDFYAPMVNNIMGYYLSCSAYQFTSGQYSRMKNTGQPMRLDKANEYQYTHPSLNDTPVLVTFTKVTNRFNSSYGKNGYGTIKIAWSSTSDKQVGYIIERSEKPDADFVAVDGMANDDVKTKEWEDLQTDYYTTYKRYYYRIRAANSLNYSNVISIPEPMVVTMAKGGLTSNVDFPVGVSISWTKNQTSSLQYNVTAYSNSGKGLAGATQSTTTWTDYVDNNNYANIKDYNLTKEKIKYTVYDSDKGVGGYVLAEKGVCLPQLYGCDSQTNTTGIDFVQIVNPGMKRVVLQSTGNCSQAGKNTSYSDLAFIGNIDYTSTNGQKLVRGKAHNCVIAPMKILSGSRKGKINQHAVFVWGDFNNDRLFTEDELILKSERLTEESNLLSLKIPADAPTGFCRLRIMLRQVGTTTYQDPCYLYSASYLGEVEDYVVQIVDDETDPVPLLSLFETSRILTGAAAVGNALVTANNAWTAISDADWLSVSSASGSAGTNMAVSYTAGANPTSASRTASITFRAGGLSKVFTVTQTGMSAFCTPLHEEGANCTSAENTVGLKSFKVFSYDNASKLLLDSRDVCSQNGNSYSDLTNQPDVSLIVGKTFPFQVEAMVIQAGNNKDKYYPTRVNIWIDLNQDGTFSDTERLYSSSAHWNSDFTDILGDYPNTLLNAQFKIPATAKTGKTRMRIRVGIPIETGLETPCESIFGETEDYSVYIGGLVTIGSIGHVTDTSTNSASLIPAGTVYKIDDKLRTGAARSASLLAGLQPHSLIANQKETGDKLKADLIVAPNPSAGRIGLGLTLDEPSPATFQLLDAVGRNLQTWSQPASETSHQREVDISSLAKGVYFIKAEFRGRQLVKKIIKN